MGIDQPFSVPVFDKETQIGGQIAIKCSSDIIISEEGNIKANLTDSVNSARLRRINGVINVFSEHNITINGSVSCSASEKVSYDVPVFSIFADTFVNHGTVQCDFDNGAVAISCSKYVNTGTISPAPDITMKPNAVREERSAAVWSENEEKVEMTVYDHRGHHLSFHPEHTLIDDGDSYYLSDGNLNREGDWIIFKLSEVVKLSRITIRAGNKSSCIKSVALWMGVEGGNWFKICKDIEGV